MEKYYIGLDIGTNSVGWAQTDEKYNIGNFNGKKTWGVRLFEEAETAENRRLHRQARRRRQRQKERLDLLMELFDKEVSKVDEGFFERKSESELHFEDKSQDSKYALFNDKDFTDKDYYKKYPTIFHLIMDLIENDEKKDIRLIYLACHYLIKYRGHFIFEGQNFDIENSFDKVLYNLKEELSSNYDISIDFDKEEIVEILKNPKYGKMKKQELLKKYFGKSKIEKGIIKLISGGKQNLGTMFDDDQIKESDYKDLNFSQSKFDEDREGYSEILGERIDLILILKEIYDSSLLEEMMATSSKSPDGRKYLSSSKVNTYNKHKKDLKELKKLIKKYLKEEYNNIFRDYKVKNNYVAYSKSTMTNNKRNKAEKFTDQDSFYKFIKNKIKQIKASEAKEKIEKIKADMDAKIYMPKLRNSNNSVIPYQLKEIELKKILNNQAKYYSFLSKKDEEGLTPIEKIVSLLTFRLPYYIGPVNPAYNKVKNYDTSWVQRIKKGRVKPWNIEKMVDVDKTREIFIDTKLSTCTYLIGEKVLAKNSLIYQEYMVLNELNNLKINGEEISIDLKKSIYNDLFKNYKKVSQKRLKNYIKESENISEDIVITGIDGDFKQGLKTYLDFKNIIGQKIEDDRYKDIVEKIVRLISLYGDDRKFIRKKLSEEFKDYFSKEEIKNISKLKFNDWGRLSRKLLVGIEGVEKESGQINNIMYFLRNTNLNLMQLMSNKFSFKEKIDKINSKYYKEEKLNYSMLEDLYLSPAAKRSLWQSLKIVDELRDINKKDPDKIFIEMARGKEDIGKRKTSRKERLKSLYKSCKKQFIDLIGEEDYKDLLKGIEDREESKFRWDDLYLYYTQLGRCMYSLDPIDISDLGKNNIYDQDHIYPKSKLYDDSIENRVLVKKQLNLDKGNKYPIDSNIVANRPKAERFWKLLFDKGLIGKKKYSRLIRKTPFTNEELAGFIERQLVETRQASKETANLLKRLCPNSEIVYVKAKNVSIFRNKFDIVKCRSLNDLHHAHDAYLNIVVGNIFHTKFTKNPYYYIKNDRRNRNYNLEKIYEYDVKRGDEIAWISQKSDNDKNASIVNVKKNIENKNIRLTRRSYTSTGSLFDVTLLRKGKGQAPQKENSKKADIDKYGGYNKVSTAYFCLIEDEKGKKTIESIPVRIYNKVLNKEKNVLENYIRDYIKIKNPRIIKEKIKINTLFKIDGFLYHLKGKSGNRIKIDGAVQVYLSKTWQKYIKSIDKTLARLENNGKITKFDNIKEEKNIELFDIFVDKLNNSIYKNRINNKGEELLKARPRFIKLSLEDQIYTLNQILLIFGSYNSGINLELLDMPKQSCISMVSKKINNDEFKIINQSITGLFEKEEDLLKL